MNVSDRINQHQIKEILIQVYNQIHDNDNDQLAVQEIVEEIKRLILAVSDAPDEPVHFNREETELSWDPQKFLA